MIAEGTNQVTASNDPTAHAEMVVLRQAARVIGNHRLARGTLYVTLEPCSMCAGAMIQARIPRVVYGCDDPKGGAVENGVKFFTSTTCHHRPEIYGGLGEAAAGDLLKQFFKERR